MKLTLFLLLTLNAGLLVAQDIELYDQVIQIMEDELDYHYDSTSNRPKVYPPATVEAKGLPPARSSMPDNPSPLVLLNGQLVQVEELKTYPATSIKKVEILEADDPKTAALFGTRGAARGVILLTIGL